MLEIASYGNPPRRHFWLWCICFISLGIFLYWGMKKTVEWSDNLHKTGIQTLAK